MPGTSRNRDEFHRRERALRPTEKNASVDPTQAAASAAYERGYSVGRNHSQAEGFFDGAQEAINSAKKAKVSDRVRGGARLEKAVKDDLKDKIAQRQRALPPPERR